MLPLGVALDGRTENYLRFSFHKIRKSQNGGIGWGQQGPWGSSGPTLAVSGPPRAAQWHTEPEGSESSQMEVIRVKYGRWEGRGANPRNERGVEDISPALFLRVSRHICYAS